MKLRADTVKNRPRQTKVEADRHHSSIGRIAILHTEQRMNENWTGSTQRLHWVHSHQVDNKPDPIVYIFVDLDQKGYSFKTVAKHSSLQEEHNNGADSTKRTPVTYTLFYSSFNIHEQETSWNTSWNASHQSWGERNQCHKATK